MDNSRINIDLEARQVNGQRTLYGVIVQEGRAASQRREIFAPYSMKWPAEGINILAEHRGASVATAFPKRETDGRLTIAIPATAPVLQAMAKSGEYLSVEFRSLQEQTTQGGIREIQAAFLSAAAFVRDPEYTMATTEVRKRKRKWL